MEAFQVGQLIGAGVGGAVGAFLITRKFGGVVPYLAALGGMFVGVGSLFVLDPTAYHLRTTDEDIRKLQASFTKGCMPNCTGGGATEAQCQIFCACVYGSLRTRYPDNDRFARWFHESASNLENSKKETSAITASCIEAQR